MRQHPGALAVGYAERVSQKSTQAWLDRLGTRHGQPVLLPKGSINNGARFIVSEASGTMRLGTDLATIDQVREAGMRATWRNEAVLSSPVKEAESTLPGFYLLLPVYLR